MVQTSSNVSTAKPPVGGALYSAPIGTALPADATSALPETFKSLGYISEDGITNSNSGKSDSVKAWGGETVATVQTEKEDTFQYTLIEALNIDVLKEVYGESNVTGNLESGVKVTANSKEAQRHVLVAEMILNDGAVKRIIIPSGKVTEVGDITYNDSDPIGYETTLSALPDPAGNTHYEYIQKAPASAGSGE